MFVKIFISNEFIPHLPKPCVIARSRKFNLSAIIFIRAQRLPPKATRTIHKNSPLQRAWRCQGRYRNSSLSSFGARQIHLFTFPAQVEMPMSLIFNQLYFPISHSWLTHLPWQIAELTRTRKSSLSLAKSSWTLYRTHEGGNQSVDKHLLTTIQVLSSKTMIWKFKGS